MSSKVFEIIAKEEKRQRENIELIASENFCSENVQKAVGSPGNLKDMATMEIDTVNSVIQSNFLRNYRAVKTREREQMVLSAAVRERLGMTDTLRLKGE